MIKMSQHDLWAMEPYFIAEHIFICIFNPIALRKAKTLWSFGHSECNRVNLWHNWQTVSLQEYLQINYLQQYLQIYVIRNLIWKYIPISIVFKNISQLQQY